MPFWCFIAADYFRRFFSVSLLIDISRFSRLFSTRYFSHFHCWILFFFIIYASSLFSPFRLRFFFLSPHSLLPLFTLLLFSPRWYADWCCCCAMFSLLMMPPCFHMLAMPSLLFCCRRCRRLFDACDAAYYADAISLRYTLMLIDADDDVIYFDVFVTLPFVDAFTLRHYFDYYHYAFISSLHFAIFHFHYAFSFISPPLYFRDTTFGHYVIIIIIYFHFIFIFIAFSSLLSFHKDVITFITLFSFDIWYQDYFRYFIATFLRFLLFLLFSIFHAIFVFHCHWLLFINISFIISLIISSPLLLFWYTLMPALFRFRYFITLMSFSPFAFFFHFHYFSYFISICFFFSLMLIYFFLSSLRHFSFLLSFFFLAFLLMSFSSSQLYFSRLLFSLPLLSFITPLRLRFTLTFSCLICRYYWRCWCWLLRGLLMPDAATPLPLSFLSDIFWCFRWLRHFRCFHYLLMAISSLLPFSFYWWLCCCHYYYYVDAIFMLIFMPFSLSLYWLYAVIYCWLPFSFFLRCFLSLFTSFSRHIDYAFRRLFFAIISFAFSSSFACFHYLVMICHFRHSCFLTLFYLRYAYYCLLRHIHFAIFITPFLITITCCHYYCFLHCHAAMSFHYLTLRHFHAITLFSDDFHYHYFRFHMLPLLRCHIISRVRHYAISLIADYAFISFSMPAFLLLLFTPLFRRHYFIIIDYADTIVFIAIISLITADAFSDYDAIFITPLIAPPMLLIHFIFFAIFLFVLPLITVSLFHCRRYRHFHFADAITLFIITLAFFIISPCYASPLLFHYWLFRFLLRWHFIYWLLRCRHLIIFIDTPLLFSPCCLRCAPLRFFPLIDYLRSFRRHAITLSLMRLSLSFSHYAFFRRHWLRVWLFSFASLRFDTAMLIDDITSFFIDDADACFYIICRLPPSMLLPLRHYRFSCH